jgi:hypothetical protein
MATKSLNQNWLNDMTSIWSAFLQGIGGLFGVKTLNKKDFDAIWPHFLGPFRAPFGVSEDRMWSFSRQNLGLNNRKHGISSFRFRENQDKQVGVSTDFQHRGRCRFGQFRAPGARRLLPRGIGRFVANALRQSGPSQIGCRSPARLPCPSFALGGTAAGLGMAKSDITDSRPGAGGAEYEQTAGG